MIGHAGLDVGLRGVVGQAIGDYVLGTRLFTQCGYVRCGMFADIPVRAVLFCWRMVTGRALAMEIPPPAGEPAKRREKLCRKSNDQMQILSTVGSKRFQI